MIFEQYYDRLQLEHYFIYNCFFMDAAAYEDLTAEDWTRLKHRITIGRFLQYGWVCEVDQSWRAQLSAEEREILANWDWLAAHERAVVGRSDDVWRRYLTPAEILEGQEEGEK